MKNEKPKKQRARKEGDTLQGDRKSGEQCSLPKVPPRVVEEHIDPHRLALVRYNEKKWVNHTVLHYCFLNSPASWKGANNQKTAVRNAFSEWKSLGIGLDFTEVTDNSEAEIRIGFEPGSSWSYVGRDSIDLVPNPAQRTMNFGWDLTTPYGKDTALHEIGHALGFPHEHQNPNAGIVWNEEKVYDYFSGPPNNWTRDSTFYNVIRKISPEEVEGSIWDRNSIMHYWFEAGLIDQPAQYKTQPLIPEAGLSETDIQEVKKFYPLSTENEIVELKPYKSVLMNLAPSGQVDFRIKPPETRSYVFNTFGQMDTVMVLFEDIDGTPVYMQGDDDSGYDYNSRIEARLLKSRQYYLRIRLYYSANSGLGAVMFW